MRFPPPTLKVPPDIDDVRRALGGGRTPAKPPGRITQRAFDFDDTHLRVLADPRAKVEELHAIDYALDLSYTPIQRDLFSFAFPRVLEMWRASLVRGDSSSNFHGQFLYALCKAELPLNERERSAVHLYMAGAILDCVDSVGSLRPEDPDRLYSIFSELSFSGVYSHDIAPLWETWWEIGTPGRARIALQWASVLLYDDRENPVWVDDDGTRRGMYAPYLWLEDGFVFDVAWREQNAAFIAERFKTRWLLNRLGDAAAALRGTPDEELAARVVRDGFTLPEIITRRLAELPKLMLVPNSLGVERRFTV